MKGKMKKILALALATVMLLAMGMTAFAEEGDKTITVTNTVAEETYTLYKIFDVTNADEGYNYAIPEKAVIDINTDKFKEVFTAKSNGGKTYVTLNTGKTAADIASYLKDNVSGDALSSEKSTGADITFTVSETGYYYIKSTSGTSVVAMLDTLTGNSLTIQAKNDNPGWVGEGKVADGETYYIGETITYTLTYKALNYASGNKVTKYVVKDTPAEGITVDTDSVKVMVDTQDITSTVTKSDLVNTAGMTIKWVDANGDFLYTVPANIVITYNATITSEDAVGNSGITNTASIYYNEEEPVEVDEKVYTGSITINKFDGNDKNKKLEATFVISDSDLGTEGAKYLKENATGVKFEWVDSIENATKYTTTGGRVDIKGLKADTYYLIETEAPAGYNLMDGAKSVELAVPTDGSGENVTLVATPEVPNYAGTQLPSTGGIGTTIFYVVGGILVLGACVLLVTKKRMSTRD